MRTRAEDAVLIRSCASGSRAAWEELFRRCHPVLVRQVAAWVGTRRACAELCEEIAGRVWLKLVDRDFSRLARFDADRGVRFTTYLVALARNEFLMFLREQGRRSRREERWARAAPSCREADRLGLQLEDCLDCLDGAEQEFVRRQLGGAAGLAAHPEGAVNKRALRKLRRHLGLSDGAVPTKSSRKVPGDGGSGI